MIQILIEQVRFIQSYDKPVDNVRCFKILVGISAEEFDFLFAKVEGAPRRRSPIDTEST